MVEHEGTDAGIVWLSRAEGGSDHGGDAQAEQSFAIHEVGVDIVGSGGARRRYVLEEAAPLVKIYDEDGVGPVRSIGHGFECVVEEAISFANVGVRMVVVAGAVVENGVDGIYEGNRGQRSGGCGEQKICVGPRNASVLWSPEPEEWKIGIVIVGADTGGGEPVPNCGEGAGSCRVAEAIGLRGVQENPIGKRRAKDGGEIAVARCVVAGESGVERNVVLFVIADGINIVGAGTQEAVHFAAVVLDATAVVGMIGIGMRAPGVVPRKRISVVSDALLVAIGQASLLAIGIGKPAKEMIKAAVFHGDHDYVIDVRISWVGEIRERGARGGGLAKGPRRSECRGSGSQREIFH